jgi:hypothetical protein
MQQLLAVNIIALAVFGERVSPVQALGRALAVLSVGVVTYMK